jgi:hypothetical protein
VANQGTPLHNGPSWSLAGKPLTCFTNFTDLSLLQYRKYKPLTQPGQCNGCKCRNVKAAYRTLCDSCAKKREACPQCAKVNEALTPKVQTKAEEAREYEYLEGVVETLRERDRRTVYRKVARGEDVLAPLVAGSDDSSEDEDASADEDEDNSGSGSDECGASDGCASDTSGAVVEGSGGAAVEGDCAKSDDFRLECSLSRDISEVLQL